MGGCGALRRCGCAKTYEGTQFLCVKFRLGSAGEPTICSHCYSVPYMKIPANNQVFLYLPRLPFRTRLPVWQRSPTQCPPKQLFYAVFTSWWLWHETTWVRSSIGNPIVEIRRSYDRLISTMGFPILVRRHLYIESGPRVFIYGWASSQSMRELRLFL